jgi:hypothetical protein
MEMAPNNAAVILEGIDRRRETGPALAELATHQGMLAVLPVFGVSCAAFT